MCVITLRAFDPSLCNRDRLAVSYDLLCKHYVHAMYAYSIIVYITQRGALGQNRCRFETWFWRVRAVVFNRQRTKTEARDEMVSSSNPVFRETPRPFAVRHADTNHFSGERREYTSSDAHARENILYRTIAAYFSVQVVNNASIGTYKILFWNETHADKCRLINTFLSAYV